MKSQEDILNTAVDMNVGTPGRLLAHIKEGHMTYGDIKYVALDEADILFDRGFAPEIRKFLGPPLRNRSRQPSDPGFQPILVTATITKQKPDALGVLGASTLQKCIAVICMLAYALPADATNEYCKISTTVAMESMKRFCGAAVKLFAPEYLRYPTQDEKGEQLTPNVQEDSQEYLVLWIVRIGLKNYRWWLGRFPGSGWREVNNSRGSL